MTKCLLVVDVLVGIFELPEALHDAEGFLARTTALLERARASGAAVVFVHHRGPPGTRFAPGSDARRFHPRVEPLPGEAVIEKEQPDAFQGTSLEATLRELGAGEVVVSGFASEACVDTTVRSAFGRGLSVVLVSDCHTTTRNDVLPADKIVAHHNSVLRRFARVVPLAELDLRAS